MEESNPRIYIDFSTEDDETIFSYQADSEPYLLIGQNVILFDNLYIVKSIVHKFLRRDDLSKTTRINPIEHHIYVLVR